MALQNDTDGGFSNMIAQQNMRSSKNRFPGDENLIVIFQEDALPDEEESVKAGHPKFRPADIIQIWVPGDRFSKIEREVTLADKVRFEEKYKQFKSNQTPAETGLPLEMWPMIHKAMAMELKHFNVRTVEQLANLSDGNAATIGPVQDLKKKAQDFLAAAKDGAHIGHLRSEIDKRDSELESLRKVVEQQGKKIEEMLRKKQ